VTSPAELDVGTRDPRRPYGASQPWRAGWARVRRFVARQTGPDVTRAQLACDLVVGAALPPVLIWLDLAWDPVGGGGVLFLRPYPGVLATAGALGIVLFHVLRGRVTLAMPLLAGGLEMTGLAALGLATLMLPLSLVGIVFAGIGLLGLLPFASAALHLRCGVRAWRARGAVAPALATQLLLIGAVATVGGSWAFGRLALRVERRSTEVLTGMRSGDEASALRRLRLVRLWPGVTLRDLRSAVYRADDDGERERLSASWDAITGDRGGPPDASD